MKMTGQPGIFIFSKVNRRGQQMTRIDKIHWNTPENIYIFNKTATLT